MINRTITADVGIHSYHLPVILRHSKRFCHIFVTRKLNCDLKPYT